LRQNWQDLEYRSYGNRVGEQRRRYHYLVVVVFVVTDVDENRVPYPSVGVGHLDYWLVERLDSVEQELWLPALAAVAVPKIANFDWETWEPYLHRPKSDCWDVDCVLL